ncbi:hypothetical protein SEA_CLOWN_81 [Gordonia phage Clown]|uniref:Uncharacterized protein n=1 Tax=Gordonia phage Clown TaxID=2759393 RepID=A0A7L7STP4_9CAUD|nr:hypothetical protein KNV25_gp81 [Gordonia phage Clown]QOC56079.1 hypothetical protein SEA_CLOWN_81 [Gordonia phage Clown]
MFHRTRGRHRLTVRRREPRYLTVGPRSLTEHVGDAALTWIMAVPKRTRPRPWVIPDSTANLADLLDGPVGVEIDGVVHIVEPYEPPADSPYARMIRMLDDMQPTIRQLTQEI